MISNLIRVERAHNVHTRAYSGRLVEKIGAEIHS